MGAKSCGKILIIQQESGFHVCSLPRYQLIIDLRVAPLAPRIDSYLRNIRQLKSTYLRIYVLCLLHIRGASSRHGDRPGSVLYIHIYTVYTLGNVMSYTYIIPYTCASRFRLPHTHPYKFQVTKREAIHYIYISDL